MTLLTLWAISSDLAFSHVQCTLLLRVATMVLGSLVPTAYIACLWSTTGTSKSFGRGAKILDAIICPSSISNANDSLFAALCFLRSIVIEHVPGVLSIMIYSFSAWIFTSFAIPMRGVLSLSFSGGTSNDMFASRFGQFFRYQHCNCPWKQRETFPLQEENSLISTETNHCPKHYVHC